MSGFLPCLSQPVTVVQVRLKIHWTVLPIWTSSVFILSGICHLCLLHVQLVVNSFAKGFGYFVHNSQLLVFLTECCLSLCCKIFKPFSLSLLCFFSCLCLSFYITCAVYLSSSLILFRLSWFSMFSSYLQVSSWFDLYVEPLFFLDMSL